MADSSAWNQIAGAAASGAAQTVVEAARNKRQYKYQQKAMAEQQRLNLETWNMQNAYNTPQQQMQRLQDAGLNPRLIYGSGSSAPNMAGPLQTAEAPVREATGAKAPLFDYLQVRQADAQFKNTVMNTQMMEKSMAIKELEANLKNLDLFKKRIQSKDFEHMQNLAVTNAELSLSKLNSQLFNEDRKGALMDQLGTMRQKQMTGIDLDNAFKQHRNELAKMGIYTSDHPAFRVLIQAARRMNIDLGELMEQGLESLQYLFSEGTKKNLLLGKKFK